MDLSPDARDLRANGLAWLDEFWGLRPGNLEAFQQHWCVQCKRHQDLFPPSRIDACKARGCGMRDPDVFAVVQVWSQEMFSRLQPGLLQSDAPNVPSALVDELNAVVAATHCVTPALILGADGLLRTGLGVPVLRGWVYASLMRICAGAGGVIEGNIYTSDSAHALEKRVTGERKKRTATLRDPAVIAAYDEDPSRSDRAIARLTGVDHKTVSDVLRCANKRPEKWGR